MSRPRVGTIRKLFAVATVAIAFLIAYQSTRPAGDPTVPVLKSWLSYVGHFGAYAVLAFCAMMSTWRRKLINVAAVVLGCSLFGLSLEVYQGGVDGRESTPFDGISNVIGAAVGATAALVLLRWLQEQMADN